MVLSHQRSGGRRNERSHEVAGRILPLNIVEHQRARRLTLRIEAGGRGLRITVPPGITMEEISRFIGRHQHWLEARIGRMPDRERLEAGMKIPLRGVPHELVHRIGGRGVTRAVVGDGSPRIEVYGDAHHFGRRIADYLKREAKADLSTLVQRHAAAIGVRAGRISLRDTASRWGSCSSTGNLSFSWRIVMAPPPVIDYLAAHEVAHLKQMNHSADFWKLCRELCPKTAECKDWLKRNGAKLHAIPF